MSTDNIIVLCAFAAYLVMMIVIGFIYSKNADIRLPMASTTKIMTALIALEKGNMNDTLIMSENAIWGIDRDSSHIGLDVGETISMSDGLYAILMSSANEVCQRISFTIFFGTMLWRCLGNAVCKQ